MFFSVEDKLEAKEFLAELLVTEKFKFELEHEVIVDLLENSNRCQDLYQNHTWWHETSKPPKTKTMHGGDL